MRFYTGQHKHYCGIDLHARTMQPCVLTQSGEVVLEQNIRSDPGHFLRAIAAYRDDLVVAVECMFTWYWLADLCAREGIAFVLGHALYMKAIHGGKAKNDRVDAHKIATLLRGGMIEGTEQHQPSRNPAKHTYACFCFHSYNAKVHRRGMMSEHMCAPRPVQPLVRRPRA